MQILFFWMLSPVHSSITETDWANYLNYMASMTILVVVCAVAQMGGLYAYFARQKRIHSCNELFDQYACMWWLLLAIPAGIATGLIAWRNFAPFCGDSADGAGMAAVSIGLETMASCLALGYAVILLPGVTPHAFKYRPREWFVKQKQVVPAGSIQQ